MTDLVQNMAALINQVISQETKNDVIIAAHNDMVMEGDGDSARRLAERLRGQMQKIEFGPVTGRPYRVTVSLGVASRRDAGQTFAELMRSADEALYAAKHAGRNRVVVADWVAGDPVTGNR